MQIIQKPLLGRKRSDGHDPLQQLSEIRENRRTRIRFHATEVTTSVEIANSEFTVNKANEKGGEEEVGEDDAIQYPDINS